jgi:hypothetical protein
MPDYKQLIRQAKLACFERLSLAASLEAEKQGLTEEELEAEIEEIKDTAYDCRPVPERNHGRESEDLERIRKRNWSDL